MTYQHDSHNTPHAPGCDPHTDHRPRPEPNPHRQTNAHPIAEAAHGAPPTPHSGTTSPQRPIHTSHLDDPRSLALPDWETLCALADALVAESSGRFAGWGDVVTFEAGTAARIGEVSGVQAQDIDRDTWMWIVRRQTTPGPGGLIDKGTKGKRARTVPIIEELREMVGRRLDAAKEPSSRLFTGPRGGRISAAVLRDATNWDNVVAALGYENLRRHDLRHTGLTWMADAGVPVHVLQKIAGHGSITTTQRYLHPDRRSIQDAGTLLSAHLMAQRSSTVTRLRVV
jgi:hypothetical protein